MGLVIEFILSVIWAFVVWVVLFPLVWLISTPFVLIIAAFRNDPYKIGILKLYASVNAFWFEWGMTMMP